MPEYFRTSYPMLQGTQPRHYRTYYAVSSEPETGRRGSVYPYGELGTSYTPRKYIVPFSNDKSDTETYSGLSKGYLEHTRQTILDRADQESGMTGRESDVVSNVDHLLGHYYDYDAEPEDTHRQSIHAAKRLGLHKEGNPETLFMDIPPKLEIDTAFFDKSMRHTFPTTVALAQQEFPDAEIAPSNDLSEHSAKVTRGAVKKGLLNVNPEEITQTNNYQFPDKKTNHPNFDELYANTTRIPQEEVSSARNALRQNLKAARIARGVSSSETPKLSAQFDQPTLFGS